MSIPRMLAVLAVPVLLASCGGGDSNPPAPASTTMSLSGIAAKGPMSGADVAVLPVNADGSIGSSALASTTTGADGAYTLTFTGAASRPFVLRVTANAGTTHHDELNGTAQPLPAGFAMRAMLMPLAAGSATVTAHVTPFSELIVAAASRASAGITAASATQARATVRQLLGFDPQAVAPRSAGNAAIGDEQRLAVLLTAVSRLADSGAIGCGSGTAAAKVRCVVETMAASARMDSLRLGGSGAGAVDVSGALADAVSGVLSTPALAGPVNPTALATVMANLACSTNCSPGSSGGASSTASAIAGAKLLFNQIRSDWQAMFARSDNGIGGGASRSEALAFEQAMSAAQVPVELLAKDLSAMLLGIDLYNDFRAGRDPSPIRTRTDESLVADDGSGDFRSNPVISCALYADTDGTIAATSPASVGSIGCGARYFVSRSIIPPGTTITTEWRHSFVLRPAADGSFSYSTRARRRVVTCTASGCSTNDIALQTDSAGAPMPAFTGRLAPTLDTTGRITRFTLVGELPAAFKSGGRTLANLKHAVDMQGTQTPGKEMSDLSGSITVYGTDGAVDGTLTVKKGTVQRMRFANSGSVAHVGDLDIVWNTGAAEFEGRLTLSDPVQDLSRSEGIPSKMVLSGALRNIAGGSSTEFLTGVLTVDVVGFAAFDTTLPTSASNNVRVNLGFIGRLTAAGRPTLELSVGASRTLLERETNNSNALVTMQYRTLVGGTPKLVVDVQVQTDPATGKSQTRLSEATADISMSWVGSNAKTVDLMHAGTTRIGTLDVDTHLLTFIDGSFISLDIGL